ncbi:hypothetical protein O5D80_007599 [Batrachochytrium dendrobatidis]|nr:hypothetical protein O5D80_007599 [Batrachochytrium dendrobatidis]
MQPPPIPQSTFRGMVVRMREEQTGLERVYEHHHQHPVPPTTNKPHAVHSENKVKNADKMPRFKAQSLPMLSNSDASAHQIRHPQHVSRQTGFGIDVRPPSASSNIHSNRDSKPSVGHHTTLGSESHLKSINRRPGSSSINHRAKPNTKPGISLSDIPTKTAANLVETALEINGSSSKSTIRSRPGSQGTRKLSMDSQSELVPPHNKVIPTSKSVSKLEAVLHYGSEDESDVNNKDHDRHHMSNRRASNQSGDAQTDKHFTRSRPQSAKKPYCPPPELPLWNSSTKYAAGSEENIEKPLPPTLESSDLSKLSGSQNQLYQGRPQLVGMFNSRKGNFSSKTSAISKSVPLLTNLDTLQSIPDLVSIQEKMSGLEDSMNASMSTIYTASSRFDQRSDTQQVGRYRATPLQWDIYSRLCPSKDEKESPTYIPFTESLFRISQAYHITNHTLVQQDMAKCINKICALYSVVRTKFYRNERIVDADIEGILDPRTWQELPLDAFFDVVEASAHPQLMRRDVDSNQWIESVAEYAQSWMQPVGIRMPFSVLAIKYPPSLKSSDHPLNPLGHTVLVFAASMAVVDEISLTWIAHECIHLYNQCYRFCKLEKPQSDKIACIDTYKTIETEEFFEFANDCKRGKSDMSFWRDQCIEIKQDSVERSEKDDIEGQLKRLGKEKSALSNSVASLIKRKSELQTDLKELRCQRSEITKSENGEGVISTYMDSTGGEVIQITKEAKAALIKAVLGDDAATDNVIGLLEKHEVPKEAQHKINATKLTLEGFAAITEADIEHLNLMSRDRRKIIALAEFVRNRIKDCLHEQSKVKFALERKIAKATRDFESVSDGLKSTQNLLESTDDMSIRLNYILKPPYVETKIAPISLCALYESNLPLLESLDASSKWGYVPLTVSSETLDNLRRFRVNWAISVKARQKQRRADASASSDNESLLESEKSDDDDQPSRANSPLKYSAVTTSNEAVDATVLPVLEYHKRSKPKSVDVVCLTAFSILLRHISGSEKYVLGVSQSYRRHGIFVGPLSDTVPIKIDVSKQGLTFDSLYESLHKTLRNAKRHGVACTNMQVAEAFHLSEKLDARFEFISLRESKEWIKKGLTVADMLCCREPCFQTDEINTNRLWSDIEHDQYDVKLVIVETSHGLEGGLKFMNSRFDEDTIQKWMTKYMSILDSIDYGPRKILVSSLISRFYHTIWQGGSTANINSTVSLYSSLSSINRLNGI